MKKSKVVFLKVKVGRASLENTVRRAMNLAEWTECIKGDSIFLKINAMSHLVVPGTNTSPWVLEAVLKEIRAKFPDITLNFGDGDLCSCKNVDRAGINWGYVGLAKKYNCNYINLTRDKQRLVEIGGVFGKLKISDTLLKSDSIISIPIMKTHVWSKMTASLKNMYGCLPIERHIYHLWLDRAIVDINAFLRPKFTLVDGTLGIEGSGPRTGFVKVSNIVMASKDLVAADTLAAEFMGFDINQIKYIGLAEKAGLGSTKYEVIGDKFTPTRYKRATDTIVTYWHKRLRFSFLEKLLFRTFMFKILAWLATQYNTKYWYPCKGRKYRDSIVKNTWYGKQFQNLHR